MMPKGPCKIHEYRPAGRRDEHTHDMSNDLQLWNTESKKHVNTDTRNSLHFIAEDRGTRFACLLSFEVVLQINYFTPSPYFPVYIKVKWIFYTLYNNGKKSEAEFTAGALKKHPKHTRG